MVYLQPQIKIISSSNNLATLESDINIFLVDKEVKDIKIFGSEYGTTFYAVIIWNPQAVV